MPVNAERARVRCLNLVLVLGVVLSPMVSGCDPGPDQDSRSEALMALPGPIATTFDPVPIVGAMRSAVYAVHGTIKYEYTDASDSLAVGSVDGPRLRVIDSTGAEVARGYAASDGSYSIRLGARMLRSPPYSIEVRTDRPEVQVLCGDDEQPCTYQHPATFTPNPFGPRRVDITVPVDHSGPFHILSAVRRGYAWYRTHRDDAWRLGLTRVVLYHDAFFAHDYYDTDLDTIYISADVPSYMPLYAERRNQFHDSVILHQFAYRLMHIVGSYHPATIVDSRRTEQDDPPTAWEQGTAIYLAQAIIGHHRYESCDCASFGTDSHDIHDMSDVPRGTSDGSDTGDIAAGLVTALLWDLSDSIAPGEADFLTDLETLVVQAIFEMSAINGITRHGTPCCRDLMDFLEFIKPRLSPLQRNDLDTLLSRRFHLD